MRTAIAILVAGVALATGVFLHEQTVQRPAGCMNPACRVTPTWADPAGILTAAAGLSLAFALLPPELRKRRIQ